MAGTSKEGGNRRQITTLCKRRSGLFKKAHELAVLSDSDVAIIIYLVTGQLFEFSSNPSMRNTLTRYKKGLAASTGVEYNPEELQLEESQETDVLDKEIELHNLISRLLRKDFSSMEDLLEVHTVEQVLSEGVIFMRGIKEQILMQQLHQYRVHEERVVRENQFFRRQIEELRASFPSTSSAPPLCIEYHPTMNQTDPALWESYPSPFQASSPSTSSATPLCIEYHPTMNHSDPALRESYPGPFQASFSSTSSATPLCIEYHPTMSHTDPALRESFPGSFQASFPSTSSAIPLYSKYHPTMNHISEESYPGHETPCNGGLGDYIDTTLQLGPPSRICGKRKTSDEETSPSTSKTEDTRWGNSSKHL